MSTWHHKFDVKDVFHNDTLSTAEKGRIVADRIRKAPWFNEMDTFGELGSIADGLTDIEEFTGEAAGPDAAEEFDGWWDEFYDLADACRIWVVTA